MPKEYKFSAGLTETSLTLFDLPDEISMDVFNENYKALADGIEGASQASQETKKLLNEMKPEWTDMKTQAKKNNEFVGGYEKRLKEAESSLNIKTSVITIRPQNATALPKSTAQIVACDVSRWVSGNRLGRLNGGVNIKDEMSKVIITGQVFFTGSAGDVVNAYIYNGTTQIARATARIPIDDVQVTAVTETIKHPTGIEKDTKTVDGSKVLTDVSLKTSEKKIITGVKTTITPGGIALAIPPIVTSCKKGDVFYLKAMNSTSSNGRVPGGIGDNTDIRTYLTVIGVS